MSKQIATRTSLAGVALALLLGGCASTSSGGSGSSGKAPEQWDGLVERESKRADKVFVRPDVKIGPYGSVMIDTAQVAFDKNWDPNRDQRDLGRRLSTEDMDRIRTELGKMLNETFAKELAAGGYRIVTTPGPDTLHISPAIVNLYINAPDTMSAGRSYSFVMDAGRMTLFAEFRDAETGQLLARAVDTKQGTDMSRLQVANSVTNSAEAQRAISSWAKALRQGLDALKETAP
jgi:hypothetical protein